jgi:hypothetical protein
MVFLQYNELRTMPQMMSKSRKCSCKAVSDAAVMNAGHGTFCVLLLFVVALLVVQSHTGTEHLTSSPWWRPFKVAALSCLLRSGVASTCLAHGVGTCAHAHLVVLKLWDKCRLACRLPFAIQHKPHCTVVEGALVLCCCGVRMSWCCMSAASRVRHAVIGVW